ncbi:MAG TPA: F0F1 ATP synthase subunit delta [Candidatus Dormibacteraeota bacterium]|nr:F0F1 ATP synthase subunit delta [Candidatus Dormibacteraeota bacterium]
MPDAPRVPSTARHYAEAVFQLAEEEGDFAPWLTRLGRLRQLLEESDLGKTIAEPTLRIAQKVELCRAVLAQDGAIDKFAGNLLLVLITSQRQRLLPAIEEGYHQLVDKREGRVLAQLTTAVSVSAADQKQLAERLSERLHLAVRFEAKVDPSLLGGAVVRLGDRVFDASLTTRLQQLRQDLLTQVPTR